jgi:hypothetical protein
MNPVDTEAVMYLMQDFLQEQKRLRDQGITLESISKQQTEIHLVTKSIIREQAAQAMRMDRLKRRYKIIEERVLSEEDRRRISSEDTGSHDVRQAIEIAELKVKLADTEKTLEKQSERQADSGIWWKRQTWLWGTALFFAVFSAVMSGCTGIIVWKVTQGSVKTSP